MKSELIPVPIPRSPSAAGLERMAYVDALRDAMAIARDVAEYVDEDPTYGDEFAEGALHVESAIAKYLTIDELRPHSRIVSSAERFERIRKARDELKRLERECEAEIAEKSKIGMLWTMSQCSGWALYTEAGRAFGDLVAELCEAPLP